jgi:hypothetical protein
MHIGFELWILDDDRGRNAQLIHKDRPTPENFAQNMARLAHGARSSANNIVGYANVLAAKPDFPYKVQAQELVTLGNVVYDHLFVWATFKGVPAYRAYTANTDGTGSNE